MEFYPELSGEFDTTDSAHYPGSTDDGEPTSLANDDLDRQLIWLRHVNGVSDEERKWLTDRSFRQLVLE